MDFADYSIVLLARNPEGPKLDAEQAGALQDAHLEHISKLADDGHLVAAGPISDDRYTGLSILRVPPDEALALKSEDPAVQAGHILLHVMPWRVPSAAVSFHRTHFPRSMAEALG